MVEECRIDHLVGPIYEDLMGDDPWRSALGQIRVFMGASNMQLHIADRRGKRRDAIFAYGPKVDEQKVERWEASQFKTMFRLNLKMGETTCFKLEDVLPAGESLDELMNSDSYWTIVHCFDLVEEVESLLLASRTQTSPAFDKADERTLKLLGQHFRRALSLRRAILRNRLIADYQAEGLDRMAIGGLLVERNGDTILLNNAARAIMSEENGLRFANGQIHAIDGSEDRQLHALIQEVLANEGGSGALRAMNLSRASGKRGIGLIIKAQKSRSLVTGKPAMNALIFARDMEAASDLDVGITQQLFGFTPAEARLAVGLAKGMNLEALEQMLHIRHNTARAHLRSMFSKADVTRQSELVHLLANCVAPLGNKVIS